MKSVLVIGLGKLGKHLASKMQELGNDVMVIDQEASIVEAVSDQFTECTIGDCTNESVIKSLGVDNFDVCFVTIGDDFQSSLVITYLLKRNGAKQIVAKARQDIQAELLKNIGAYEVIFPEKEMAERIAVRYNSDQIFDFIPFTSELAIYEITTPARWVGKTIAEVNVRAIYDVNIIGVKRGETVHQLPGASFVFRGDDHLVVIGKSSDVFRLNSRA